MPYFITSEHPDCDAWATVKDDGELIACHETEQDAIDQMVAASLNEDLEPGGTYEGEFRAEAGSLQVGDFVRWNSSGGIARGQIVQIVTEGTLDIPDTDFTLDATEDNPAALIRIWREDEDGWDDTDTLVGHRFATLTKIDPLESDNDQEDMDDEDSRAVNLEPPAYMRAAARQGLKYHEEGKSGDGIVDATIREARAMASGTVTADKWVRLRAWIARHLDDLDSPAANPQNEDYPSPGVVAHLLWGSGPSKRAAQRALQYAEGVVERIQAEAAERGVKGEAVNKLETRINTGSFELRETQDGMVFEGYAAIFDSPSEPLPFTEKIQRGAFKRTLRARNDIKLLWNHDSGQVLASTRARTLALMEDERGLKVSASLPNTTLGRDTAELLRRGDVDSMSFGFSVVRDSWNSEGSERTLEHVRLHEVSIVAWPAYTATSGTTSVRALDRVAQRADVDVDALADALLKIEAGEDITTDDRDLLTTVIDKLSPEPMTVEEENDLSMLLLKKKKLELLKGI
jgi:HK97 family phage prohead protease